MDATPEHVRAVARSLLQRSRAALAHREAKRARIVDALPAAARLLKDDFGATRAFLIGSLTQPWFSPESDVDIAVEGVTTDLLHTLERRLVALFAAPVDLLRLEELTPAFVRDIETEGRRIV